jgi:hypothetical protein
MIDSLVFGGQGLPEWHGPCLARRVTLVGRASRQNMARAILSQSRPTRSTGTFDTNLSEQTTGANLNAQLSV